MVKLNARCSAILQNELPLKEKDPGSFILPCTIGTTTVSNALADLEASISIMPFSLFKRMGLGNPKPVNMVIEIADRFMQSPKGIVENVLIKINKFIFPIDFIILGIIEDDKVPIILRRPMLSIAHARIDVFEINEYDEPINLEELLLSDEDSGNNTVGFFRNLHVFVGGYQFLTNFIILESINEFVEKGLTEVLFGQPFKEHVRIVEDWVKGVLWFKIKDDKTIFNMPCAKERFGRLTVRQHNTMGPLLKISDKDKSRGIHHPYQGCLKLGKEYKHDQEVINWIKNGHAT
ncbi:homeodomain-like protein [Tanacetum coccineum]